MIWLGWRGGEREKKGEEAIGVGAGGKRKGRREAANILCCFSKKVISRDNILLMSEFC